MLLWWMLYGLAKQQCQRNCALLVSFKWNTYCGCCYLYPASHLFWGELKRPRGFRILCLMLEQATSASCQATPTLLDGMCVWVFCSVSGKNGETLSYDIAWSFQSSLRKTPLWDAFKLLERVAEWDVILGNNPFYLKEKKLFILHEGNQIYCKCQS